jgi:hypothetical protein
MDQILSYHVLAAHLPRRFRFNFVLLTVTHSAIAMTLQRCILPILRNSPGPHPHVSQLCVQMGLRRMATKLEAQEGTTVSAVRHSRVRRLIPSPSLSERHHSIISMSRTVQRWFRLRAIICPLCMATSARVLFLPSHSLMFLTVMQLQAISTYGRAPDYLMSDTCCSPSRHC